jgi:hypothetical protein
MDQSNKNMDYNNTLSIHFIDFNRVDYKLKTSVLLIHDTFILIK